MDYKKELEKIEKTINERKLEKARAEERIKTLESDIAKIKEQLKEIGITDINDLQSIIDKQKKDIEEQLTKLKEGLGI